MKSRNVVGAVGTTALTTRVRQSRAGEFDRQWVVQSAVGAAITLETDPLTRRYWGRCARVWTTVSNI